MGILHQIRRRARRGESGQSLIEFALVLPLMTILALGVSEYGYVLLDDHVATKLAREGSNLISRDTSLQDAATAIRTIASRPVDFNNGSKLIFSVLKKGATSGSANYNQTILYQRYEYGSLAATSKIHTAGSGSFSGGPDYTAANADSNTGLRVTNVSNDLINAPGGMIYVTEIFTTHTAITPLTGLGVYVPNILYAVAYF